MEFIKKRKQVIFICFSLRRIMYPKMAPWKNLTPTVKEGIKKPALTLVT